MNVTFPSPLVMAEIFYIGLVLIGGMFISLRKREKSAPLKGLNLPEGSVRSMLALIIVGTFVIFLVLGDDVAHFQKIVSAFSTLTGAVLGFYFGNRATTTQPNTAGTGGSAGTGEAVAPGISGTKPTGG